MAFFDKTTMHLGNRVVKVLLVEDSGAERMRMQVVLQNMGLAVIATENATEALRLLKKNTVDIVLSDWRMPGVTGLELCQRLAAEPAYGRPYFIMLTGQNAGADLIAAMDSGADDFIAKPVWGEELRVRLQAGIRSLQRSQVDKPALSSPAGLISVAPRTRA